MFLHDFARTCITVYRCYLEIILGFLPEKMTLI